MPQISIKSSDDREKVDSLLTLAKKTCLISNSIKCKVELTPEIKVEE